MSANLIDHSATVIMEDGAPTVVMPQQAAPIVVMPQDDGTVVILSYDGPPGAAGEAGAAAKVGLGFSVNGPYTARQAILPAPVMLDGSGTFTAANSLARAWRECTAQNVWSVTRNGTFASEDVATDIEIASALFATITFPAGPGNAVWSYPNGGGFVNGDAIRVWESATPDATQAKTSVTFAGA